MGFLDNVGNFFEDVSEIPGDIVEAGASLFDGPGGVAGIFVSGGVLLVGGPGHFVTAFVAGVVTTEIVNAMIKTRTMSSEERTVAEMVFGNTLPPYDKVIITNLNGIGGRAFVMPNPAGEFLINIGSGYDDPLRYTKGNYPEYGQLLIHELTHVWQAHHASFLPSLLCHAIVTQIENEFEEGVYNPGDGKKSWSDYNTEQQSTIVDRWYRGWDKTPCSTESDLYPHIVGVINKGNPPPAVQTLSMRAISTRKYGTHENLSVEANLPRHGYIGTRSIRKNLIGLKG